MVPRTFEKLINLVPDGEFALKKMVVHLDKRRNTRLLLKELSVLTKIALVL